MLLHLLLLFSLEIVFQFWIRLSFVSSSQFFLYNTKHFLCWFVCKTVHVSHLKMRLGHLLAMPVHRHGRGSVVGSWIATS